MTLNPDLYTLLPAALLVSEGSGQFASTAKSRLCELHLFLEPLLLSDTVVERTLQLLDLCLNAGQLGLFLLQRPHHRFQLILRLRQPVNQLINESLRQHSVVDE
jgi:hypothetical protein